MNDGIQKFDLIENEIRKLKRAGAVRRIIWDIVKAVLILAAIVVLVTNVWMPVFQIYGSNMDPALQDGNYVVALKQEVFQRGDVIVFNYYNKLLVKRVIAIGGDVVDIAADGTVSVNGIVQDESYVTEKSLGNSDIQYPYTVPANHLFVMGDNRANSIDSRASMVGPIGMEQVVGKVVLRVWPFHEIGVVHWTCLKIPQNPKLSCHCGLTRNPRQTHSFL